VKRLAARMGVYFRLHGADGVVAGGHARVRAFVYGISQGQCPELARHLSTPSAVSVYRGNEEPGAT
jgi:hypothetical protein